MMTLLFKATGIKLNLLFDKSNFNFYNNSGLYSTIFIFDTSISMHYSAVRLFSFWIYFFVFYFFSLIDSSSI